MPETVCVTVEQLREWRKRILLTLLQHESTCAEHSGGICDCGNNAAWLSMEEALGQPERLEGWKPKIAQPVRIVAMSSVGPLFIATLVHGAPDGEMAELFIKRESGTFLFGRRYLAELMPEEG